MRPDYSYWSSAPLNTALFALATLAAWTITASLFVLLSRAPLTRGAPVTIYYATACSLLPWFAGSVFWIKVRKRAKLGIADRDATGFCYGVIFTALGAAYAGMFSIESVLLSVLTRVH
jgi:hypothetical protein